MANSFSDRLKSVRKSSGLTQGEFAEKIGVSTKTQNNYETEKRFPDLQYLQMLTQFNVDFNYLIKGTAVGSGLHEVALSECIAALEGMLDRKQIDLEPEVKAKFITMLYEEYMEDDGISENKIERGLRLVS